MEGTLLIHLMIFVACCKICLNHFFFFSTNGNVTIAVKIAVKTDLLGQFGIN